MELAPMNAEGQQEQSLNPKKVARQLVEEDIELAFALRAELNKMLPELDEDEEEDGEDEEEEDVERGDDDEGSGDDGEAEEEETWPPYRPEPGEEAAASGGRITRGRIPGGPRR